LAGVALETLPIVIYVMAHRGASPVINATRAAQWTRC